MLGNCKSYDVDPYGEGDVQRSHDTHESKSCEVMGRNVHVEEVRLLNRLLCHWIFVSVCSYYSISDIQNHIRMDSLPWTECDMFEPSTTAIPLVVTDHCGQHHDLVSYHIWLNSYLL